MSCGSWVSKIYYEKRLGDLYSEVLYLLSEKGYYLTDEEKTCLHKYLADCLVKDKDYKLSSYVKLYGEIEYSDDDLLYSAVKEFSSTNLDKRRDFYHINVLCLSESFSTLSNNIMYCLSDLGVHVQCFIEKCVKKGLIEIGYLGGDFSISLSDKPFYNYSSGEVIFKGDFITKVLDIADELLSSNELIYYEFY